MSPHSAPNVVDTPSRFRAARRELGLTQVELADLLGGSERWIRKLETGATEVNRVTDYAMRYLLSQV